jgi:hypothetical protein
MTYNMISLIVRFKKFKFLKVKKSDEEEDLKLAFKVSLKSISS